MQSSLAFNIPFNGMAGTSFINCFSAVCTFVEKTDLTGAGDEKCKHNPANSCGGCGAGCGTTASNQAKCFLLFDTICGHSSLRCRFDGTPTEMQKLIGETDDASCGTDHTVDFLFGFAGYEYRKLTNPVEFQSAIHTSINAGKPVIAIVKTGANRFRVITGYDNDALLSPNYANAQNPPDTAPAYDELDTLIFIGDKTTPRHTFADGLARIVNVMEHNRDEKLWDVYIEKIGWYGWNSSDGMKHVGLDEKKRRMQRVTDTMWHTFNSHVTAEVFRHRLHHDLRNPAFDELCKKIGGAWNGYTHDLAAGLIGLNNLLDWTNDWHGAGYAEIVQLTLYKIRDNDLAVLDAIKQIIKTLQP